MRHSPSRRQSLLTLLCLTLFPLPAQAAVPAEQVVESMVKKALGILRDPKLKDNRDERKKQLRAVADQAFNWEAMARGSLGHYWRDLKDEQRLAFVSVFKELLANQYMDDIDRFQGNEDVKMAGAVPKTPLVLVKTVLVTGSHERVPMDYTLQEVGGKWMIEDLAIEGVSMVSHYRDSFKRFLVNKSFEDLLALLKRKLGAS